MCVCVKEIYSHFNSLTHILRFNTEYRSSLGLQLNIHFCLLNYIATAIQEVIFQLSVVPHHLPKEIKFAPSLQSCRRSNFHFLTGEGSFIHVDSGLGVIKSGAGYSPFKSVTMMDFFCTNSGI